MLKCCPTRARADCLRAFHWKAQRFVRMKKPTGNCTGTTRQIVKFLPETSKLPQPPKSLRGRCIAIRRSAISPTERFAGESACEFRKPRLVVNPLNRGERRSTTNCEL